MAVAERLYARALFQAAEEQGRLEAVHRDLSASSPMPSRDRPS